MPDTTSQLTRHRVDELEQEVSELETELESEVGEVKDDVRQMKYAAYFFVGTTLGELIGIPQIIENIL